MAVPGRAATGRELSVLARVVIYQGPEPNRPDGKFPYVAPSPPVDGSGFA